MGGLPIELEQKQKLFWDPYANEMGLDRAPIEFQTFYFSHVLVVPPSGRYMGFLIERLLTAP